MSNNWSKITVQFGGGCELLFGNKNKLLLDHIVPCGSNVSQLVQLLKDQYVQERPELFVDAQGTGPRPGILVLVNACDVEVVGGMAYVLEEGDEIEFISTLHGG